MDYKVIKQETSVIDGSERLLIQVNLYKNTLVRIKNTRNMSEQQKIVAIFNELIRLEPSDSRKQDIARKRYNYEQS